MTEPGLILVIEDSPTQAQRVSTMIKMLCGLNVTLATDGVEALRLVEVKRPDVIVLDVNLPGMDGYQLCKRLKRDPHTASIPIIMLTTADTCRAATYGLEAGADDFFTKPFSPKHLIGRVKELLHLN